MRIEPIIPVVSPVNPPRQRSRAIMMICCSRHIVVDTQTNERHELPARKAWDLHQHLNMEV